MLSSAKQTEVLNKIREAGLENHSVGELHEKLYPDQVSFGDFLQCVDAVRNENESKEAAAKDQTKPPQPETKEK